MASPDQAIRSIVDETIDQRRADAEVMAVADPTAIPIARAHLLYLWDEYRTELLDFAAFSSPVGHGFDRVINSVADHLRYYGYTAPQGQHLLRYPVSYAKSLSEAFSAPEEAPMKVLYTEGEREAIDWAVRLARRSNQRPYLAILDTGKHDWIIHGDRYPMDDPMSARVNWESQCALLVSPVTSRADGVPPGLLRRWMLDARAHQVPVIVDESVSGFGRLGTMWGQERAGLVADLTVLGGPVGGGLPLGAIIGPEKFFPAEHIHVSPQAGHPWACAAGAAVLEALHPGVLAHVEDSARHFVNSLDALCGQFPTRLDGHHGFGLLRGLRFKDTGDARRFPAAAHERGLHLAPAVGDTIPLAPVLISSSHEVTRGVDLMAEVLMSWEDV